MLKSSTFTLQVSATQYKVTTHRSGDTIYDVNTLIGCCSCHVGKTGGPCKHQAAVIKHFDVSSTNFVPVNDRKMRLLLYKIATGSTKEYVNANKEAGGTVYLGCSSIHPVFVFGIT